MVKKLWLKDFRNFGEVLLDFKGKSNVVIYGDNNQGKTNLLESIFYLGNASSHREPKNENLIGFDKSQTYIGMEISHNEAFHKIYFKILRDGKRLGTLDQQLVSSVQGLRDYLTVEYISSDVIKTFQESPDYRRDVLNRFCCHYFDKYLQTLQGYNRILKQKNFHLKNIHKKESIDVWNEQLVDYSAKLVDMRRLALVDIEEQTKNFVKEIFPDFYDSLCIEYKTQGITLATFSVDDYKEQLMAVLNEVFEKEKELGYSVVGAHRDDFCLHIKDRDLSRFFSRGINRSLAFFIRLSQIDLLAQKNGIRPILLLDDPFAEIDGKNKELIINRIDTESQIFYASIYKSDANLFRDPTLIHVSSGDLTPDSL